MQKYYAIDLSTEDGPMRAAVYKVEDVENVLKDIFHAPDYARETVRQILGVDNVPKPD